MDARTSNDVIGDPMQESRDEIGRGPTILYVVRQLGGRREAKGLEGDGYLEAVGGATNRCGFEAVPSKAPLLLRLKRNSRVSIDVSASSAWLSILPGSALLYVYRSLQYSRHQLRMMRHCSELVDALPSVSLESSDDPAICCSHPGPNLRCSLPGARFYIYLQQGSVTRGYITTSSKPDHGLVL